MPDVIRKLIRPKSGRQAGRHNWFDYTSTKCSTPDDMAVAVVFILATYSKGK
jgi:hypothetical protein